MNGLMSGTQTHSLSLESRVVQFGMEAWNVADLITTFTELSASLKESLIGIASSFSKIVESDRTTKEIQLYDSRNKTIIRKTQDVVFGNYEKTLTSVPEGFKGNFIAYLDFMISISPIIYTDTDNLLSEYQQLLSRFITNKDDKISLQDHTAFYEKIRKQRETMSKSMDEFFDSKSNQSKLPMKKVMSRFADVETIIKKAAELDKDRRRHNLKDTSSSVTKVIGLLDILLKNAQNKGITDASPPSTVNISKGAFEVGKHIEFLGIYAFRVEQILGCVDKLLIQLEDIL